MEHLKRLSNEIRGAILRDLQRFLGVLQTLSLRTPPLTGKLQSWTLEVTSTFVTGYQARSLFSETMWGQTSPS